MRNLKILIFFITLAFWQHTANAQPGILDIVFKSKKGNIQETVTVDNQIADIISISIFDNKNQIVHRKKHSLAKSNKVLCILPKNIYRVVITNVTGSRRLQTYRVNVE